VHELGARSIAEAARAAGVPITHVSALGTATESDSAYARSKARGEAAVFEALPDAMIFRPSIVFGPEDQFFNRFANLARFSPVLPLIGGGHTRFQPVYVGDVAEAIARSVDGTVPGGRVVELGGPEIKTFRECLEEMLRVIERKRLLVPVPWFIARVQGAVLGLLPNPLLTTDQVTLLRRDNVVSAAAEREGRTLEGLGMVPTATEAILASYLWRFRPAGQFTQPNAA
jgi:NADH dehydrogenase